MATLYEFIGAKPEATRSEIEQFIQLTETRLRQTGQIYDAQYEIALRKVREVLLDPEARREYDKKLNLSGKMPQPKQVAKAQMIGLRKRGLPRIGLQIPILAVLLVVLGTYVGYVVWQSHRPYPMGCYLLSTVTGRRAAVLISREEVHPYLSGKSGVAYQVKMMDNEEVRWVGDLQLHAEFLPGPPAPPEELKVKGK